MLELTQLNGEKRQLPAYEIREIKSIPDTLIVFLNGNCQIVRESIDEIIAKLSQNPRLLDFRAAGTF